MGKRRRGTEKPEGNRRRLQRMLRSMMRNGMEFSAAGAFGEVSLSQTPCRRVIE